ncbi:hypothetical protein MKW94_002250, partial [Papaver nudicaule]|nr:hypothetical protein [Papaver nudicaule]
VVGLNLVDDESKPKSGPTKHMPTPEELANVCHLAFSYYICYCCSNLHALNQ